jgi:hypothetical protein
LSRQSEQKCKFLSLVKANEMNTICRAQERLNTGKIK